MKCEKCAKLLIWDETWLPPRGIDPLMRKLVCPVHEGVFQFAVRWSVGNNSNEVHRTIQRISELS